MKKFRIWSALALAAACGAPAVDAAVIYAIDGSVTNANRLVSFNSATPGTILSDVAFTGLNSGEFMIGLDFRPSNGLLYGYVKDGGASGRVVQIDTTTGALTSVGVGTSTAPNGTSRGFDFNPVADRIRTVTNAAQSHRYNPNDGTLVLADSNLAYGAGDANQSVSPTVTQVAYTNNVSGALVTTLFGIDTNLDILVRIGGVDGSPSPNGGLLTTIGALGINADNLGGFDIDATGSAYLVSRVGGVSNLYTINLGTGAATLVGAIGSGTPFYTGMSVQLAAPTNGDVPEPSTFALTLGAAALLYFKRRR